MKVFNFLLILLFTTLNLYSQQTPLYWMDDSQYPAKLRPVTFSNPLPIKITNQLDTNKLPFLNKDNTFTGTNYFRKLIADTVTINNITKANSTYWINGTDTLGWIDAARSDVVFFPKMTVGTLTTNTTVANNFVRTNQVQTDTLVPHSPLILAGDTTIARKFYADSVFANSFKTGSIYVDGLVNNINGVNILNANIISANGTGYFNTINVDTLNINGTKYWYSNGWVYTNGKMWIDGGVVTAVIFPWTNHTGSVGTSNNYYANIFSDTVETTGVSFGNGLYIKRNGQLLSINTDNNEYLSLGPYSAIFYCQVSPKVSGSFSLGNTQKRWLGVYSTLFDGTTATFSAVPVYADNAAAVAGGLTAGQLYKTSSGQLMIVY